MPSCNFRGDVVADAHARLRRVLGDLQRVGAQLRRRRQPSHALGTHIEIDHRTRVAGGVRQRRQQAAHVDLLVAPLVGMSVEERRAVHVPRRAYPVGRERQHLPAGLRTQLFLPDVVRPSATRYADAAAQHQHVDRAAVDHVLVVPVVDASADDDHRAALGLFSRLREFSRHGDQLGGVDTGDLFLPFRRVGNIVVVRASATVAEAAVDAIVRAHQVEHRRHVDVALGSGHATRGDAAQQHVGTLVVFRKVLAQRAAEIRKCHRQRRVAAIDQRHRETHVTPVDAVLLLEVPFAEVELDVLAPAMADRPLRRDDGVGNLVEADGFPFGAVALPEVAVEIGRAQVAIGNITLAVLAQPHQQWQVGVAASVVVEIGHLAVDVEFLENHMAHCHADRRIGALLGMQPHVAETRDLRVIRRDRHDLGAVVAAFDHEVRIGRARLRHVGAPGDDELGVVPIGRLGNVGLLAPHLRR